VGKAYRWGQMVFQGNRRAEFCDRTLPHLESGSGSAVQHTGGQNVYPLPAATPRSQLVRQLFLGYHRTGFGPYDTEVERSEKFLTGKGFSADLGLKVAWDRWFAKLHYEHFQPTLNVNPVVMQESVNEGFVIDSQKDFKLSSLNLSVGTSLTF
jgi:hypothetical protein